METKPKTIIIRITQEQHEYLTRKAYEAECTISKAVRDIIDAHKDEYN